MPVSAVRAATALLLTALAAPAALAEPSFVPVYRDNFPDPHVVPYDGQFVAYATNAGVNMPMLTSRDLITWSRVTDPANPKKMRDGLPKLGAWAKEGFTWAPEVAQVGNRWLLYYTASSRKLNSQCVGVAVADNPLGPFVDTQPAPIVCQTDLGGTIDADLFRDADGSLYLYYKNDGNRIRKRTMIWGQRLTPDGLKVSGAPVQLIDDLARWKDRVVESPSMIRTQNGYVMFYSAGYFGWNPENRLSPYAMGYATCAGPLGPCTDAPENPILHSFNDKDAGCISGPGHQSVFQANGKAYIAFHAWAANSSCRKQGDARELYVAPLYWRDGKPAIGVSLRPTAPPQR